MAEWLVGLKGDKAELEYLCKLCKPSSQSCTVMEQHGTYYLKSALFDSSIDAHEVLETASRILDVLNGIVRLVFSSSQGAEVTSILGTENDEKPPTQYIMPIGIPSEEKFGIPTILVGQELPEEASIPGSKWLEIAEKDTQVDKALALYGGLEPNWRNLYIVLEAIEDDVGGEKELIKEDWAPKGNIKLFKQTAANFRVLGREARHSTGSFEPPSKPMRLKEAQSLIRDILEKWLCSKV